jgi:hypothetical protein
LGKIAAELSRGPIAKGAQTSRKTAMHFRRAPKLAVRRLQTSRELRENQRFLRRGTFGARAETRRGKDADWVQGASRRVRDLGRSGVLFTSLGANLMLG